MSPRPRKPRNNSLPPNLYTVNGGKQYRYKHPVTGKFHGMGSDRAAAISAAKQLNGLLVQQVGLVARVIAGESFKDHCDWFLANTIKEREYKPATVEMYQIRIRQLTAKLGQRHVDEITVQDVSSIMEGMTPRVANQFRQVAVDVFKVAQSRGLIDTNPADVTLKRIEKKSRKRLTLEWFKAIHARAEPWLQNAMDIALHTLQRRGDVTRMRFDDVRDGRLYVIQEKTEKYDTGYLSIKVGPELDKVFKRCRDNVASPFLVHRKPDRKVKRKDMDHWTQVKPEMISRAFADARDLTKIFDEWKESERPTFHEIRALGVKLYKDAGKDPQKLAGHSTEKMTKNYDSGHDEIRWNEVDADLSIG